MHESKSKYTFMHHLYIDLRSAFKLNHYPNAKIIADSVSKHSDNEYYLLHFAAQSLTAILQRSSTLPIAAKEYITAIKSMLK
jgi:hypothetical protein